MARNDDHKERAKTYLLAHPTSTNEDVAKAAFVSKRTVTNARVELIAEGKIAPAWGDHKRNKIVKASETVASATEGTFDTKTTADLNAVVAEELVGDVVDIGKLKRVLWRVVHRNTDDRIVVAAASALARIQQEAGMRLPGPGKPMTKAEAIERLIMMFKAVGVTLVVEALNIWMGKGAGNEGKLSAEHGEAAPSPAGATPAS